MWLFRLVLGSLLTGIFCFSWHCRFIVVYVVVMDQDSFQLRNIQGMRGPLPLPQRTFAPINTLEGPPLSTSLGRQGGGGGGEGGQQEGGELLGSARHQAGQQEWQVGGGGHLLKIYQLVRMKPMHIRTSLLPNKQYLQNCVNGNALNV